MTTSTKSDSAAKRDVTKLQRAIVDGSQFAEIISEREASLAKAKTEADTKKAEKTK